MLETVLKAAVDRRFSARVQADYQGKLSGIGIDGRPFKDYAVLENLSSGGLYLRLMRGLREGSEVIVTVRLSSLPSGPAPLLRLAARGTVLRVEERLGGGYGVAVEFKRRRIL